MHLKVGGCETNPPRCGVLLVGHGTRDRDGVGEFMETANHVAQACPELVVEPCFLELAEPAIPTAIAHMAQQGIEQFVVLPLLLFAAGHAKRDVPDTVASAMALHPQMAWQQAPHLGCHPAILEQSAIRFEETLAGRAAVPKAQTALVMVGRGSLDEDATQEMHEFAKRASQSANVGRVDVCFYAMAKPALQDTLERIADENFQRVIVQPHLLYGGVILEAIREAVEKCASKNPATEWLVVDRLVPTSRVAAAVLERAYAAFSDWPTTCLVSAVS